jgi:acyl carrier protein
MFIMEYLPQKLIKDTKNFLNMKSLLEIINEVLDSNEKNLIDKIEPETNLRDDLGFDSFMLAELTIIIEEIYGVDIFADGIVFTISDIQNKIK